jgi:SAM-dependent methyltransferase
MVASVPGRIAQYPEQRAAPVTRTAAPLAVPAIEVVDGAAESIPLEDGSVDALWTVNTIHHWTERDAASRELARVMKTGGRVLLVDEDFEDPSHPEHRRMRRARARHEHPFEEVDPDRIAAALRRAGFAEAHGSRTTIAGRPAKVIRAVR